jgi:glycosyltransferase involved in cell wall biosynthesis
MPKRTNFRVAFDQRLASYRGGGIARYQIELGDALARQSDIEVHRLLHSRDTAQSGNDVRLRTPPHHRLEPYAIGLELAARRRSFDAYHATDFVAPRFIRYPVVVTVHDLAFIRWPDHLSPDALAYYRQVTRQAPRTDHWITPSAWTKSELVELVGVSEQHISIVPHGVSSFVERGAVRPREERDPVILAIGTVEPRKRYHLLLDAFERMSSRLRLCVVGAPGWNTQELQKRLRSSARVTWLDTATDDEINDLVSRAVALAIPSLAEGFGLGMLEAMARGTPVVSSGLGALSEVAGSAAFVPDDDSPTAWAEALDGIAGDLDLWNEFSGAGLARAANFTWSEAARRTAEVYRLVGR